MSSTEGGGPFGPSPAWWASEHPAALMVPLVALTLGVITVGQRVLGIPDAAFHLVQGRIVLDFGFPERELLAFTSHDGPWVLQSWLADAAWALVERAGGLPLLHVVLVAMVVAVYLAIGTAVWRRAPGWTTPLLLLLLLVAATSHLTLRPSLLSVGLLVLTWALARGWGPAWFALPLFALWANVHGAFLVGIALIVVVIAGEALEGPWGAGLRPPRLRRGALVLAAGLIGSLATPYGPTLWVYLTEVGTLAPGVLTEWMPPDLREAPAWSYFLLLALAVTGFARSARVRLADLAVVLFGLALALAASRNTTSAAALTAVVAAPYVATLLPTGVSPARTSPSDGSPGRLAILGLGALTTVVVLLLPLRATDDVADHVDPRVPVDLIMELPDGAKVSSNAFVGPYVSLVRWPDVLVAHDGRIEVYPPEVFSQMREVGLGMPGWDTTLNRVGATHVLVLPSDPLADALAASPEWSVVGRSPGGAVMYGSP